jgi:hypothetical protein
MANRPKKTFFAIYYEDIDRGVYLGWTAPMYKVWMALKRHEGRDHTCYPGYQRLQTLTGYSNSKNITLGLRQLEAAGALQIERSRGVVNRYLLLI